MQQVQWYQAPNFITAIVIGIKSEIEKETQIDKGAWSEVKFLFEKMKKYEDRSRKYGVEDLLKRREKLLQAEAAAFPQETGS